MGTSPSPALVEEIMKLGAFQDIKQHIVSTTGTESQMIVKYLKDESSMLAIISAVRECSLKRKFSAEREVLKLMIVFDNINYAGHITYQHAYLNNSLRKDKSCERFNN